MTAQYTPDGALIPNVNASTLPVPTPTPTPTNTGGSSGGSSFNQGTYNLQQQLNAQHAGQAGYVPLKLDGIYGPLTDAATKFTPTSTSATSVNTDATPAMVYPGMQEDPALEAARQAKVDYYNGGGIDEQGIRNQTMAMFQAEIDATNQLYAEKLKQAKLTGANRVGSGTAIQARRGLLGSDFGGAITDSINTANNEIYGGIEAEKAAAIAAILGNGRKAAADAIAEKRAATEKGLDAKLEYLQNAGERKTNSVKNAAQFLLDQGYDPAKLSKDEFAKVIAAYPGGISADEVKAQYTKAKKEKDLADAKAAREGQFNLSEGQARYDANGKVIAQRAKTYAPGSGTSGTSVQAQSWADLINSGRATLANVPAAMRSAVSVALSAIPMKSIVKPEQIDALLNNPKFDKAFGPIDQFAPKFGEAALAKNQTNQILAQLKLDGRKILKGQGAVSDWEGKTVGEAASTITSNLNEKIARRLLTDLKKTIQNVDAAQGQAPANEPSGEVIVTDPDGNQHSFPDQASADAFKQEAGIE